MTRSIAQTSDDAKIAKTRANAGDRSDNRLAEGAPNWSKIDHVYLSKNFGHFPPCRTAAATPPFVTRTVRGEWVQVCELHDGALRATLPADEENPRLPDVGDMDLLARLLAGTMLAGVEVRHRTSYANSGRAIEAVTAKRGKRGKYDDRLARHGRHAEKLAGRLAYARQHLYWWQNREKLRPALLRFKSLTKFIRAIGRDPHNMQERKAVKRSLLLWHGLRLRWSQFHVPNEKPQRVTMQPINDLEFHDDGRIDVRLDIGLVASSITYSTVLPFPLAADRRSPAAFNLMLLLACWREKGEYEISLPALMEKIGLVDRRGLGDGQTFQLVRRLVEQINARRPKETKAIKVWRRKARGLIAFVLPKAKAATENKRVGKVGKARKAPKPRMPLIALLDDMTDEQVADIDTLSDAQKLALMYGAKV